MLWEQCSSALQSKIKSLSDYHTKSGDLDALWLLKELRKSTAGLNVKAEPRSNIIDTVSELFRMKQGRTESNDSYFEVFKVNLSTLELAGGSHFFCSEGNMTKANSTPTSDEFTQ